jgi:hypothetical protein
MIEAAQVGIVNPPYIADKIALAQLGEVARSDNFISVDAIEKEQKSTSRYFICMKRAIVGTAAAWNHDKNSLPFVDLKIFHFTPVKNNAQELKLIDLSTIFHRTFYLKERRKIAAVS